MREGREERENERSERADVMRKLFAIRHSVESIIFDGPPLELSSISALTLKPLSLVLISRYFSINWLVFLMTALDC